MSVLDAVRNLNNETAWQQARDAQAAREESMREGSGRNVGGVMGKNDFLMLLSAQLRFQDPLNPQSDSEFASQLAQFSSLEQMQNMNATLSAMSNYQAYSLVGKAVIAEALIDVNGKLTMAQIPGIIESVFIKDGTAFAQIGEYIVPVSAIKEVFDSSSMLTPDMLIQTSNNLIGRTVIAQVGDKIIEGVVTRVKVDGGYLFALVDDGSGESTLVPVGSIFDIRETGTPGSIKQESDEDGEDDEDDEGEEEQP